METATTVTASVNGCKEIAKQLRPHWQQIWVKNIWVKVSTSIL
jgi:hypothetical protein